MRILCIDDDRVSLLLFEHTCLQDPGIELRCAETAAEAEETAADWRPDVLVIDLHLPDASGLALLPRLRALWPGAVVPAALFTAEPPDFVERSARDAGFDAVWPKPLPPHALPALLSALGAAP